MDCCVQNISGGIATEHATFQTNCPPYTAWDASHTRECRLVVLDDGVVAGWAALHRVDPRWCYRGVAEVSIYVGEKFRGKGLGYHLLTALCREAEQAGYWTLQSTVLQDNAPPGPAPEMRLPRGGPPGAHCSGLPRPLAGHLPDGAAVCSGRTVGL